MKDTQLYQQLLGLSAPWSVSQVDVDMDNNLIIVHIECAPGQVWVDPDTRQRAHVHGWIERQWRHLDTCQLETRLVAKIPRIKYSDGRVEDLSVPWAERYSRITLMMEAFVLRLLQASSSTSRVSELVGLNWHTIAAVMKRGVERGLARREATPIKHLGLDEKSFASGHSYASVLTEPTNGKQPGRVLDVVQGRTLVAAKSLLATLSTEQRLGVEAIALDMWPAFMSAATTMLDNAALVHDKFHVSKYLGEAVDAVRKSEHRKLLKQGNKILTGSKYFWLKKTPDQRTREAKEFAHLHHVNLKTARAWAIKESFAKFWEYRYKTPALNYFNSWAKHAMRSKLEPMKKVVLMLRRHQEGLLNYITHRITNATAEGFNSAIQTIKANARGFRSFENYRIRILFFCGKLDLMPAFGKSH
jgi:transposase